MKIIKFGQYLDGGTTEIITDSDIYCFDSRLGTNSEGRLYNGYPKKDNSNLIENYQELEKEIIEALKSYKDDFYQESINNFIKNKI